jgi:hypothetical protein
MFHTEEKRRRFGKSRRFFYVIHRKRFAHGCEENPLSAHKNWSIFILKKSIRVVKYRKYYYEHFRNLMKWESEVSKVLDAKEEKRC